jgi:trans-aconitate 2-methyltransferase
MGSDWDGRRYDEVNALQRWVADQSLAALELRGDERVLDLGCGDGRVTAEVAALVPTGSVLGVDPSPRMLDVARGRIGSGPGHLAFEPGTAETLAFDAAFDVVVSFNALHWVDDLGEALRRVRAALVPGGSAYLQLVCDGERPSVEDVTLAVTRRSPYDAWLRDVPAPFHHRDPAEVAELARAAGLELADHRVDDLAWDFGSPDDLRAWLAVGFADWLRPLPEEHREPLLTEAAADYAALVGSPSVVRFLQLRDRFVAR